MPRRHVISAQSEVRKALPNENRWTKVQCPARLPLGRLGVRKRPVASQTLASVRRSVNVATRVGRCTSCLKETVLHWI